MSEPEIISETDKRIGFSEMKLKIMQDGAIDKRTKKLIALACAAATGCDQCVVRHKGFTKNAGISDEEIEEALLVASLIRMGSGLKYIDDF
jgi:AhpD family alkylhydroperoxidase